MIYQVILGIFDAIAQRIFTIADNRCSNDLKENKGFRVSLTVSTSHENGLPELTETQRM